MNDKINLKFGRTRSYKNLYLESIKNNFVMVKPKLWLIPTYILENFNPFVF